LNSGDFSAGVKLAGGRASKPESRVSQLSGDWQRRENTEHGDHDDDVRLTELMEDIKRYIRSIDIGEL